MRLTIRIPYLRTIIKDITQVIILFFFLFEFPVFSILTTRRLACVISILYLVSHINQCKGYFSYCNTKKIYIFFIMLLLCFIISIMNYLIYPQTESIEMYCGPHFYVYEFLYIFVFSVYMFVAFGDEAKFLHKYLAVIIFQTICVFLSAFNKTIRLFFYERFYTGDDRFGYAVISGKRVMGLNLHSSLGSFILFSGCFALIILKMRNRISATFFSIVYVLIIVATFFVGRTGFYFALALMVLYFFLNVDSKSIYVGLLVSILGAGAVIWSLGKLDANVSQKFLKWSFEIFNSETRYDTINVMKSMPIPKLSYQSIFGTNIIRGTTSNGTILQHDSGYIKMIGAIGYIGMSLYFASYIYLLTAPNFNRSLKNTKGLLYIFIASIFIYEIKEPCIMRYDVVAVLLTMLVHDAKKNTELEMQQT